MVNAGWLIEKAPMKTNMTILRFTILLVCLNAFWSTSALAQPVLPKLFASPPKC